jgi:hypothetical protein
VGTVVVVLVGLLVGDLFGATRLWVLHSESIVFMERRDAGAECMHGFIQTKYIFCWYFCW